jgi:hypothetical protein
MDRVMALPATPPLGRHYLAKLTTNLLGVLMAMVIRGAGTSTCSYTRLSQRAWNRGLLAVYGMFALAAALLVGSAFVRALQPLGASAWPGESWDTVLLAGVCWWLQVSRKMIYAYGLTVPGSTCFSEQFLDKGVVRQIKDA